MPDPYLARVNRALRALGSKASLELTPNGETIRLRATMPTQDGGIWTRQRISTRLAYPQDIEAAQALAEELAMDLRRARAGQPFPFDRWTGDRAVLAGETVSGCEAVNRTERWWRAQRTVPGGDDTWQLSYAQPLRPLLSVEVVTADVLRAMVRLKPRGSRARQKTAIAVSSVAKALAMPSELAAELKAMGQGYSSRSVVPRDLPSDASIEAVIDALPQTWQWVAGICAAYGSRPHEALLHAEVQASGLLLISAGKTGARQSLPLPRAWVERWDLARKRLPAVDPSRGHAMVGRELGRRLARAGAPFRGYDLRHAWAVRAILNPKISPSLAAKSMGHSLTMHSTTYQRWFDESSMVGVMEAL